MKNREKYADRLEDFIVERMAIMDGKFVACDGISCPECYFGECEGSCGTRLREWLDEEYVEPKPKLTKRERDFIDCIVTDFHLVKQVDGSVALFVGELILELDERLFPFVTKMTSKKELLQMEVEDD